MRMWKKEALVAACILGVVPIIKHDIWEVVGALAVFIGFMHGQIAERHNYVSAVMEKEGKEVLVDCWKWSMRYFIGKEIMWIIYFIHLRAWSALIGCGLYALYPIWRKYYHSKLHIDYGTLV